MDLRNRRYAAERLVVLCAVALATAVCTCLELTREVRYHDAGYRFLYWNLTLAWIPLVIAIVAYDRYRRGTSFARLTPLVALWLLFLPNAPYIVTDFVHLSLPHRTPLWLDGITLAACAATGMLLGFVSLYLVHAIARHRVGATAAWGGVAVVLGLSSVGVVIGRFLRWNSWDVVWRPGQLLVQVRPHLHDSAAVTKGVTATVVIMLLLAAAYFSFYALVGTRLEPESSRTPRA